MVQKTNIRTVYNNSQNSPKYALRQLIKIQEDILSWTVRYAAARRKDEEHVPWSAVIDDIEWLDIKFVPIMKRIAELGIEKAMNEIPPIDYWSRAIKRVGYRLPNDDRTEYIVPGVDCPKQAEIIRVDFNPDPYYLPYSNLLDMLRKYAHQLGLKLKDVVYKYDDEPTINIVKFSEMVRVDIDSQPQRILDGIRYWRTGIFDQLDDDPKLLSTSNYETKQMDRKLSEVWVSRPYLAKLLGRTPRALKYWDQKQCVPTGVRWQAPKKLGWNDVRYNAYENWDAILSMLPETRDKNKDRQLAEEILGMKECSEA